MKSYILWSQSFIRRKVDTSKHVQLLFHDSLSYGANNDIKSKLSHMTKAPSCLPETLWNVQQGHSLCKQRLQCLQKYSSHHLTPHGVFQLQLSQSPVTYISPEIVIHEQTKKDI